MFMIRFIQGMSMMEAVRGSYWRPGGWVWSKFFGKWIANPRTDYTGRKIY